ncbi:MAG: AAA family ATPase, partial [Clostridia bacterium]|nr:AAA family ATPase [Clostridia bacterium]
MLLQVSIRNFAIFKDAVIEPGSGYNVITGESGAGKSIVVNALSLICGARAYREMIRTGEASASVEAVFRVPAHKMKLVQEMTGSDEDTLVITRDIHRDRSSVCKINGKIRNLSQITELSSVFIDIHGQYENQNLLNVDNHILYLDDYAKKELKPILNEYNNVLNEYRGITNEIISVSG